MTSLKSGDLVVLKSGGPVMTVDSVNTDIFDDNKVTGILCAWFIGDRLERARFDPAALMSARSSVGTEPMSQEAEAAGEYKAVLDDMVAAMNDATDTPETPREATGRTATGRSRRESISEDGSDPAGVSAGARAD